jgi:hypothetical protein
VMTEPCRQGYRCIWGRNTGTRIVCSLPRCPVLRMQSVTIDKLSKQVSHYEPMVETRTRA